MAIVSDDTAMGSGEPIVLSVSFQNASLYDAFWSP